MQPLRCVVADDQVTLEFEIDLYNAGTAPARAVLAEASMLNAGGTQEQELSAFFANPVGAGQRDRLHPAVETRDDDQPGRRAAGGDPGI